MRTFPTSLFASQSSSFPPQSSSAPPTPSDTSSAAPLSAVSSTLHPSQKGSSTCSRMPLSYLYFELGCLFMQEFEPVGTLVFGKDQNRYCCAVAFGVSKFTFLSHSHTAGS